MRKRERIELSSVRLTSAQRKPFEVNGDFEGFLYACG